jgi:cold shock CspA family protein
MATGTIKKLVRERGFGFILGQDGAEIFFHRSAIEVERGDKGPRAVNLKVGPPSD